MAYVPVLESTLAKLTEEEKANLQESLDSYAKEGYDKGYDDGRYEGYEDGWEARIESADMYSYPRADEE